MSTRIRCLRRLLTGALLLVASTCAGQDQTIPLSRCAPGVHESESHGTVAFPQDSIHCPLLADPKEPRSFASLLRGTFRTLDDPSGATTTIVSVGIGDTFGLVRWNGRQAGDGVQIDVVGAVFAQFDFNAPSKDLINADYTIGFPITFRTHGFSTRVRVYHQSSHLGDEFLLRDSAIQRENLSFESIELLLSQEIHALRVYGGAERLFRREPDTVGASVFHGGAEFRSGRAGPAQMVAAVDMKTTELYDWSPAISGRVGLELIRSSASGHPARLVTLMAEFYNGPSPYGQFFQDDISYAGFGIHFSL
ncbi:MAG TPA: DUF1207 domain-containing protein [Vicinamibacterales bacterium]